MNDFYSVGLITLGIAVFCAALLIPMLRTAKPSVVPVILRRRELQEELNARLPQEEVTRIVREECARRKRPSWDLQVLEACVRRATAIEANQKAAESNTTRVRAA